jgi:hypothetical protein
MRTLQWLLAAGLFGALCGCDPEVVTGTAPDASGVDAPVGVDVAAVDVVTPDGSVSVDAAVAPDALVM